MLHTPQPLELLFTVLGSAVRNSLKALAQRQGTSQQLGQKQYVPLPHSSPKTRTPDPGKGQPFLGQRLSQGLQMSTAQQTNKQTALDKTRAPWSLFGMLHLPTGAARTSSTFFMFSGPHDSLLFFQKAFGKTMYLSLWAEWNCGKTTDDDHISICSSHNLMAYHPKLP